MFTKGTGIVCEYNPFHNGHAYQIQRVKQMGAAFVVCAMSGDFTQRGAFAFQDKRIRAQNAVKNGADIVLEIPFPYSSMSAQGFAMAGISILEKCGLCSSFAFGSECGDVEKLQRVAQLLTPSFHKRVLEYQKQNKDVSYAVCREALIKRELGGELAQLVKNPNDILGCEYINARKTLFPIAIKRTTPRGSYDESFASSSYIRNNFYNEQSHDIVFSNVPTGSDFSGIFKGGELFYKHLLLSLLTKTPKELSDILEVPKGSEYAIIESAKKAKSYDELKALLSNKTMTDSKISRMLLLCLFGVGKEYAKTLPLYTEVLASSDLGKKMLKKYRDERQMIVASRVAEIKRDKEAMAQYDFSRMCGEALWKMDIMCNK